MQATNQQSIKRKCRLFVGNPGVGKSTLANCLVQKPIFKAGMSLGSGLTHQLDKFEIDDFIYMDTPGLSDTQKRKQAAEAITKALKQDGPNLVYQVFFVVTLLAGRVRPDDTTTIKLVLESATEITSYSIIINQLTPNLYKKLKDDADNGAKLLEVYTQINVDLPKGRNPPKILLLPRVDVLEDADDTFTQLENLQQFVENAPSVTITPNKVTEVPGDDSFDKTKVDLEKRLSKLQEDKKEMKKEMEKMRDAQKIQQIIEAAQTVTSAAVGIAGTIQTFLKGV